MIHAIICRNFEPAPFCRYSRFPLLDRCCLRVPSGSFRPRSQLPPFVSNPLLLHSLRRARRFCVSVPGAFLARRQQQHRRRGRRPPEGRRVSLRHLHFNLLVVPPHHRIVPRLHQEWHRRPQTTMPSPPKQQQRPPATSAAYPPESPKHSTPASS